jgi:hypothetical protein
MWNSVAGEAAGNAVKNSVTIDWTLPENVRAQMRVIIKPTLRNDG